MDADDYFKNNKLRNINNYFLNNPSKKIVYDEPLVSKKKIILRFLKNVYFKFGQILFQQVVFQSEENISNCF